jgi:hypothetical protein
MFGSGRRTGFAAESFDRLTILGNVVGKEFKSDIAAQARVFGFVDHAHTPAAKFFEDGVVGNRAAKQGGGIRHRPWSLS